VLLMILNAVVLSGLHLCYPRDVRRMTAELERRRGEALTS
jgi:hypothetical protein